MNKVHIFLCNGLIVSLRQLKVRLFSMLMFAAAMAFTMSKSLEDIRHGLRTFNTPFFQPSGRINVFDEHPFKVILDYADNPASVATMCY